MPDKSNRPNCVQQREEQSKMRRQPISRGKKEIHGCDPLGKRNSMGRAQCHCGSLGRKAEVIKRSDRTATQHPVHTRLHKYRYDMRGVDPM
jgi:hypothetical protein